MEDHNGNTDATWWNSAINDSAYIDFTKPEAAKWYTDRLKTLQEEAGIDSFKFDAGETSWLPQVLLKLNHSKPKLQRS